MFLRSLPSLALSLSLSLFSFHFDLNLCAYNLMNQNAVHRIWKISNVYEPTGWRNEKFSKITNYARITFIFHILIGNVMCVYVLFLWIYYHFFVAKRSNYRPNISAWIPETGAFTRAQYFYCIIIHTLLGYSIFFSLNFLFHLLILRSATLSLSPSFGPSSHASSSLCKCFSIRENSFFPWSSLYIYSVFFSSFTAGR